MTKLTDRFEKFQKKLFEFMEKEPEELCLLLFDLLESEILRVGTRWI